MAVVMEAALAQCGPSLDAVLRGADDPHAQVEAQVEAGPRPPAVPQPLLDADTRAVAAAQLSGARLTPELARAAQDATSVVGSAERLVAASPYRRAVAQIAARRPPGGKEGWLALPAMSASLALVARISARGDEGCRSFERAWRPRWTDLASGIQLQAVISGFSCVQRAELPVYASGGGAGLHPLGAVDSKCAG